MPFNNSDSNWGCFELMYNKNPGQISIDYGEC